MKKFRIEKGQVTIPIEEFNRLEDLNKDLKEQELTLKAKEAKLETEYKAKEDKLREREEALKLALKEGSTIISSSFYLVDDHRGYIPRTTSELDRRLIGKLPDSLEFKILDEDLKKAISDEATRQAKNKIAVMAKDLGLFKLRKFLKSIEIK